MCGWEIEKRNGLVEYVENSCKCKTDQQCVRTTNKDYRLHGYNYHCKRIDELGDSSEVITFPRNNKIDP